MHRNYTMEKRKSIDNETFGWRFLALYERLDARYALLGGRWKYSSLT